MKNAPARVSSAPNVPEQQVTVLPLVVLSVELPPVVPSLTGIAWALELSLGNITVTAAFAVWLPLDCTVAVTVTVLGFGKEAGAVYRPLGLIVPPLLLPPPLPFTLHIPSSFPAL